MMSMLNLGSYHEAAHAASMSNSSSSISPTVDGGQLKTTDDGWESVEVEEMGAVAPSAPTSIDGRTSYPHPSLHQYNPILSVPNLPSPTLSPAIKQGNGLGPQLSYLQIAGSLSSPKTSSSGSSSFSTSSPLVPSSPFSFAGSLKDGDEFKVAFGNARDKLHLFERRFGGDDNVKTTPYPTNGDSTPTKKRKTEETEDADQDARKRKEKKRAKKTAEREGGSGDDQKKKTKKSKKKKSKSKSKKDDGSSTTTPAGEDNGDDKKPEGGFTFMQGAYFILKREHRFMTAKEIVAIGMNEELFASSKGKTPEATVAAGIYVDLKKPVSQFCQGCKVGKRGFGLSEWADLESIPGPPDTPVKTRRRTAKSEGDAKKGEGRATTTRRANKKKRDEAEEEQEKRRQAEEEDDDEEVEEEMVIVEEEEEEEDEEEGAAPSAPSLRPLPFGSPFAGF